MPKLTIDGKEIEVDAGTTVISAAERLGIFIPRYCWHPGLSIAGNCRMCLVEIEKMPKLTTACSTVAADGMVVRTKNERVKEAQDAVLEFLLINHPLDCPICDQAGECRLQEFAFKYGPARSRFLEEKVHKPKNVDIGEHIVFDAERCILCTRCVRFCQEVSKTSELTVSLRGDHATIETAPGKRLDNAYSGNTVDICPVGALTLKEFRFRQRVWFLKDVASICPGCARGCNVLTGISKERILRLTPRLNPEVNRWWICDEGRLSYERLYRPGRIQWARVSRDLMPRADRRAAAGVGEGALIAATDAEARYADAPAGETPAAAHASASETPAAPRAGGGEASGGGPRTLAEERSGAVEASRAAGYGPASRERPGGPPLPSEPASGIGKPDAAEGAGSGPAADRGVGAGPRSPSVGGVGPAPFIPRLNEGVPPAPRTGGPAEGETVMAVALDAAARLLDEARRPGAEAGVAIVASARATNEDLFALARLAREAFGVAKACLPSHERGADDDLLIRKDKTPNRRGALEILEGVGLAIESEQSLLARLRSGEIRVLLALGPHLMGLDTDLGTPAAAANGVPEAARERGSVAARATEPGRQAAGAHEPGRKAAGAHETGQKAAGAPETGQHAAGASEPGRKAAGAPETGQHAAGASEPGALRAAPPRSVEGALGEGASIAGAARPAGSSPSAAPGSGQPAPGAEVSFFQQLVSAGAAAGVTIVAIDAFDSPLTQGAAIVLPALTYGEIEGTFTNFEGRVQRVRAGLAPGADGLPIFRIAQELARRLGLEAGRPGAQEQFSALAARVPAFGGLSYATIGESGAPLTGARRTE